MKKKVTFAFVAMFTGCAAALAMGEIAARLLGLGYASAPLVSDPLLHHRLETDFSFISYSPSGEWGGFKVTLDHNGLPQDPAGKLAFDETRHKRLIAFMGDSFVEGIQLPYEQGFCGQLNLRAQDDVFVKCFGCSSYSPVLQLLQWRTLVRSQRPVAVVLMLYSNDIQDDATYASVAHLAADGIPNAVPGPPQQMFAQLLRQSHLARYARKTWLALCYERQQRVEGSERRIVAGHVEENPRISGITERCLLKLVEEVRESGAGFTLTAVPSKYEHFNQRKQLPDGSFADHVSDWAIAHGVDYLDLEKHFESADTNHPLFFKTDIHFNKEGHSLAARAIAGHFPQYFGSF